VRYLTRLGHPVGLLRAFFRVKVKRKPPYVDVRRFRIFFFRETTLRYSFRKFYCTITSHAPNGVLIKEFIIGRAIQEIFCLYPEAYCFVSKISPLVPVWSHTNPITSSHLAYLHKITLNIMETCSPVSPEWFLQVFQLKFCMHLSSHPSVQCLEVLTTITIIRPIDITSLFIIIVILY
jgi:hypothetical protein